MPQIVEHPDRSSEDIVIEDAKATEAVGLQIGRPDPGAAIVVEAFIGPDVAGVDAHEHGLGGHGPRRPREIAFP